jgi:Nucleotidyltransferase domain
VTRVDAEATNHLRRLAARLVEAARERIPLRAAILVGSAGRGDADFYSDLDLLLYVDQLPGVEALTQIRNIIGGANPSRRSEPTDDFCSEEFDVNGIRTEVSFLTVNRAEQRLDRLLEDIEAFDSPLQKILSGLLERLPLHGEDFVERWRDRVGSYPERLRRAIIERHWNFFPVWYYGEGMARRDSELWRLDMLLDAAFNLLAVLAALNRLYFTRFELKRTRTLIARMALAPPHLADRLESLCRLEPDAAADQLGRLINETRALVMAELPDLQLPLPFPPGTRQQPWSP